MKCTNRRLTTMTFFVGVASLVNFLALFLDPPLTVLVAFIIGLLGTLTIKLIFERSLAQILIAVSIYSLITGLDALAVIQYCHPSRVWYICERNPLLISAFPLVMAFLMWISMELSNATKSQ